MKFFTTVKQKIGKLSDQAFLGSSPINPIIKENRQMLEAELKLSLESNEGIQALQDYSEIETPASKEALSQISETLKKVEESRRKMVEQLRLGFLRPFEYLSDVWKEVEILKKEKQRAEKALEHANKTLVKKQEKAEKNPEKMKENELELAEQEVKDAKEKLEKINYDLEQKEEEFHQKKLNIIKNSFKVLIEQRKQFHNQSKENIEKVKPPVLAIKVGTEGKLYANQIDTNDKEEKQEKSPFKSKIINFTERITKTDLELAKVIRENKQILDAHSRLMKETTEAISVYKSYAEKESPDIKGVLNRFAGALEIIETNRQAFIEQMKFEFIEPLHKLSEDYKILQEITKEAKRAEEKLEKAQKKLKKIQEKPEEKRKPEDLTKAEQALHEAEMESEKAQTKLKTKSITFGTQKAKTLKDSLNSLIERNLKFHQQASNIIQNAEILG
ncbi:MAG: hypothetical protein ACTSWC_03670 [Promethearchaeota archaeon]